ncbi:pyridoxal phosphate-dependent aminotransferase [Aliiroseovarius sp. 2305UL8-7]|uniref:pyridoxal phosphate-dependent aminotransferase n=1 Tax=Aliiroseovarius conchicola TaxID=3121637 RepID=UPI0035285856
MSIPIKRIRDITFPSPPAIAEPGGWPPTGVSRLNLNETYLPPSPRALDAARTALTEANRYPDHGCTALADEISHRTGISVERISFGNGSDEILVALALLAIDEGKTAVMPTPSFPTIGKGVQIAGGRLVEVPLRADGSNDVAAMLAAITPDTRLFYLCTPNNPTGAMLGAEDLAVAAHGVPEDILLVVDEAYHEFAQAGGGPDVLTVLADRAGPWVVTRTFSKAYCLAGLRIGYALTNDGAVHNALWRLRPGFNVNRPAIAAATEAMRDDSYLRKVLKQVISERASLALRVQALGFRTLPSFANFLTMRGPWYSEKVVEALNRQNISVQHIPWPDGKGALRITVGSVKDTHRLVEALTSYTSRCDRLGFSN